ncbi:TetR/AcrR family transcriptional regulator [Nitratireductor soli]|uniref:TetR/AcrR family transcriptional regulator n=1 Tax=Nitratireductor soli TaxID=1670619 RepID=UPI00065E0CB1|nr:TetR/AcrR family transcriptional regulator [Nitratireductor soli]
MARKKTSKSAPDTKTSQRRTLSREAWVKAARKVLEKRGIAEVKIDRLARHFKVTRGSFYFHFSSLKDLHDELLNEWRRANCAPFEAKRDIIDVDGLQFFTEIVHIWVDENPFSPLLDLAVRDWSRVLKTLGKEVAEMDDLRIQLLERAFRAMGYGPEEGLVRARLTYFHQIGQYALSFTEDPEQRKRHGPIYGKVLLAPLVQEPNLPKDWQDREAK